MINCNVTFTPETITENRENKQAMHKFLLHTGKL